MFFRFLNVSVYVILEDFSKERVGPCDADKIDQQFSGISDKSIS